MSAEIVPSPQLDPQENQLIDRVPSAEELQMLYPDAVNKPMPEFVYEEPLKQDEMQKEGIDQTEKSSLAYRAGKYIGRIAAKRALRRASKDSKADKITYSDLFEDINALRKEKGLFFLESRYGISDETRERHLDKIGEMKSAGYPEGSIELMKKGTLHGRPLVEMEDFVRNGRGILSVRKSFADIYAAHPETAEQLIDLKIVGLHGTRSSALPDILQQGSLLSAREVRARGLSHTTGEHIFQKATGQSSISFTTMEEMQNAMHYAGNSVLAHERSQDEVLRDLADSLQYYEEVLAQDDLGQSYKDVVRVRRQEIQNTLTQVKENPDSLQAEMLRDGFPVLFGISAESALKGFEEKQKEDKFWDPKKGTTSDYNEFRAAREVIDIDELVIAVPEARIAKVKALYEKFGHKPLAIVPIEHVTSQYFNRLQEQLSSLTEQ